MQGTQGTPRGRANDVSQCTSQGGNTDPPPPLPMMTASQTVFSGVCPNTHTNCEQWDKEKTCPHTIQRIPELPKGPYPFMGGAGVARKGTPGGAAQYRGTKFQKGRPGEDVRQFGECHRRSVMAHDSNPLG